jgi:hypothetical protein
MSLSSYGLHEHDVNTALREVGTMDSELIHTAFHFTDKLGN